MTIKSRQKVIKIGTSLAVTLPAKDAKSAGITAGKSIDITAKLSEVSKPKKTIDAEYEAFKSQYGQTLKNLADR